MQITTKAIGMNKYRANGFGKQITTVVLGTPEVCHAEVAGLLIQKNGGTSAMFHPSNTLSVEGTAEKAVWKFKKIL